MNELRTKKNVTEITRLKKTWEDLHYNEVHNFEMIYENLN